MRNEIEYQIESNGELTEVNDNDINETMNIVEKYVCTALYDKFVSSLFENCAINLYNKPYHLLVFNFIE